MSGEKPFYVRKASGLIRKVSGKDVLFYNMFQINLTYVLYLIFSWVNYPGSSMEWAIIICIIGSSAMTLVYAMYSIIFPRSGAEYVYLTRSLPPALGYIFSWNNVVWQIWFTGANAAMISFGAISPLLTSLGLITDNQNLLSLALWTETPLAIFIIGETIILFFGLLLALGMKKYFALQKALFALAIAGFAIGAILMLMTSQVTFISRFNQFMSPFTGESDTYHTIINTARQEGLTLGVPISVLPTLKLTIWVFLAMGFCVLSSSFAGEVKKIKKSQTFGMLFSVLIAGLIFIVWTSLGQKTFGADFIQSITYLDMYAPQASIFPTTPWLSLFAGLLTDNIVLSTTVLLGFFSMSLLLPVVTFIYASRAILAWSVDRLTPDKLGEVSEKYHTPIYTILVIVIASTIFNALYAIAGDQPILINILMWGIFGMTLTFFATVLAGAFFPYFKKEFYKGSPAQIEIAGIPVMTIAGIIAAIYTASMIYWFLVEEMVGTNTPEALATIATNFIIGAIVYHLLKWLRRRQGINVELAYKEIPIE